MPYGFSSSPNSASQQSTPATTESLQRARENFYNAYNQIVAKNQQNGYTPIATGSTRPFYSNSGTDYMYNGKMREANPLENIAINVHKFGEGAMNWQAELAGALAGEQAKEDWTFDPNKFNIADWSGEQGLENLNQIKNFAASLPGQMVGGLVQAPGQLIGEALIGDPYTEAVEKNGKWYIPDYEMDLQQRAGAGVNAAINVAGTFTGGTGRVLGSLGKAAFVKGMSKEGVEAVSKMYAAQTGKTISEDTAKKYLKGVVKKSNLRDLAQSPYIDKNLSEKVATYADKMEKWENRSKGLITRAYESTHPESSLGRVQQVVVDALEEGGEEFIQEYAESGARYKNDVKLEDALTSAAWGMAGGGLASGAGALVNGIAEKGAKYFSSPTNDGTKDSGYTFDDSVYDELQDSSSDAKFLSGAIRKNLREKLRQQTEQDASGNGVNVSSDPDLMPHQGRIGFIGIARSFNNSSDAGKQKIADAFGTDVDSLSKILNGDSATGAAALTTMLQEQNGGKGAKIAIGRSPATKNGGAYIDLIEVFDGEGIKLHTTTFAQYGSDVDGDVTFYYFDTSQFPALGYASQFLVDSEQKYGENGVEGASQVPYWYAAFTHEDLSTEEAVKNFKDRIVEALASFKTSYDDGSLGEHYANEILNAMQNFTGDQRDFMLAKAFTSLQADVNAEIKKSGSQNALQDFGVRDGMEAYGRVLNAFMNDPASVISRIRNAYSEQIKSECEAEWDYSNPDSTESFDEFINKKVMPIIESRGKITDVQAAIQVFRHAGLAYKYLTTSGNPTFRQNAQILYPFTKQLSNTFFENSAVLDLIPEAEIRPILESYFRVSVGMLADGVNPRTAVESIANAFIVSSVVKDSNGLLSKTNGSVISSANLDEVLNSFIDAYNKMNVSLKAANLVDTTLGDQTALGFVERSDISANSPNLYDAFLHVFGSMPIKNLIDPSLLSEETREMTFNDFVKEYSKNPAAYTGVFVNSGDLGIQSFFDNLIESYKDSAKKIRAKLLKILESIDTSRPMEYYKDNGQFGSYLWMVYRATEALQEIIDPDIAARIGLFDPETFVETAIGRKLISDENIHSPEERLTACSGISIYTQFETVYKMIKYGIDQNGEECTRDLGDGSVQFTPEATKTFQDELNALKDISPLHRYIAGRLANGDLDAFEIFVSPDLTLAQKQDFVDTFDIYKGEPGDFVVDSLMSEKSEFGYSPISQRLSRAERHVKNMRVDIIREVESDLRTIKSNFSNKVDNATNFRAFVKDRAKKCFVKLNRDVLVGQAWEAAIIAHDAMEKGTVNTAASIKDAMLDIVINGAPMSFQEQMFSAQFGEITLEQAVSNPKIILKCLSDPDFSITVKDVRTGRNAKMNIYTLFIDCGVENLEVGQEINENHYIEFFTKNPHIATLLCDSSVSVAGESLSQTKDGGLLDAYKDWSEARRSIPTTETDNTLVSQTVDDALAVTEEHLFNDPLYPSLLYSVVADYLNKNRESFNRANLRKYIAKAHAEIVASYYVRAVKRSIGVTSDSLVADQNFVGSAIGKLRNEIAGILNDLELSLEITSLTNDTEADSWNQAFHKIYLDELILESCVGAGLNEILDDYENLKERIGRDTRKAVQKRREKYISEINEITAYRSLHRSGFKYKQPELGFTEEEKENLVKTIVKHKGFEEGTIEYDAETIRVSDIVERHASNIQARVEQEYNEDVDLDTYGDIFVSIDDDQATSKEKIKKLILRIGEPATSERIDAEYSLLVNDDGEFDINRIEEWNTLFADRILAESIEMLNSEFNSDINAFAYSLLDDILTFDRRTLERVDDRDSLVDDLKKHDLLFGNSSSIVEEEIARRFDGIVPKVPVPDTMNGYIQGMISAARVEDDAAGTANHVSNNGSRLKLHHGLGFLPATSRSKLKVEPDSCTSEELEKMVEKDPNVLLHKVVVSEPGSYPAKYKVDTVESVLRSNLYPDIDKKNILYFNPLKNPHGLSYDHMPQGINKLYRTWHRLSHIIDKIDVETMEGMVMKAKKTIGNAVYVVEERKYGEKVPKASSADSIANLSDPAIAQKVLQNELVRIREEYSKAIQEQFNGPLKGLNYGGPQADMLACLLCPGIRLTINNGGNSVDIVIDANTIFEDASTFTEQYQSQIFGQVENESGELVNTLDGNIVLAQAFTVSPEEVSFRIINQVKRFAGDAKTQAEAESVAEQALDFSDYEFDNLNMSEVINQFDPLGNSYIGGITLSDSQNAPQILIDDLFDSAFGTKKGKPKAKKSSPKPFQLESRADKAFWKAAKNLMDRITAGSKTSSRDKDRATGIVKVFGVDDHSSGDLAFSSVTGEGTELLSQMKSINTMRGSGNASGRFYSTKDEHSVVLCISKNSAEIEAAIKYAVESGNYLIFPVDPIAGESIAIFDQFNVNANAEIIEYIDFPGEVKGQQWVLCKPESRISTYQSRPDIQSKRKYKDFRNNQIIVVDEQNRFLRPDAGIGVLPWGASNIGVKGGNWEHYDASALFSGSGKVRYMSATEKDRVVNFFKANGTVSVDLDSDQISTILDDKFLDKVAENNSDYSKDEIKKAIEDYIIALDSQNAQNQTSSVDDRFIRRDGVGRMTCVGFITNGKRFYPILTAKNSTLSYDWVDVIIDGNDLFVPWSGQVTLSGDGSSIEHMKFSLYDEIAFKGIASIIEPNINGILYEDLAAPIATNDSVDSAMIGSPRVSMVVSYDTYKSRAVGKTKSNMLRNFYEISSQMRGSFIFEQYLDEDGKVAFRYNSHIEDQIKKGVYTREDVASFLNDGTIGTNMVLNGKMTFTSDPDTNALIIQVVQNCKNNGQSASSLISRINWMPGSNQTQTATDITDVEMHTAFKGLKQGDVLKFFHDMMGKVKTQSGEEVWFCPNGAEDLDWETTDENGNAKPICLFDGNGRMWINNIFIDTKTKKRGAGGGFEIVLIGTPRVTGEVSGMKLPGNSAAIAWQQITTRGMDQGFSDVDYYKDSNRGHINVIEYGDFLNNNPEFAMNLMRAKSRAKSQRDRSLDWADEYRNSTDPGIAPLERKRRKSVIDNNRRTLYMPRKIMDGDEEATPENKEQWSRIQNAIDGLKQKLEWDGTALDFQFVDMWIRQQFGGTVDEKGNSNISLTDWLQAINDITTGLTEKKDGKIIPISCYEGGPNSRGRFALPWQTNYQVDMLIEHSGLFQRIYGTDEQAKIDLKKEIKAEGKNALDYFEANMSQNRSQSMRLFEYAAWIHLANDEEFNDDRYIYNNIYQSDYIEAIEQYARCLNILGEIDNDEIAQLKEYVAGNVERLVQRRQRLEKRSKDIKVKDGNSASGNAVVSYYDVNYIEHNMMDRATQWVQLMALLDPMMPVANILDRGVHQTMFRRMLQSAKKHNGKIMSRLNPYSFKDVSHALDEETINLAANQDAIMLWDAIRQATVHGMREEFLVECAAQGENMFQWLREQQRGTKWSRIINTGFKIGSGGRFGVKQQFKLFLDLWVQEIEEDPLLTKMWLEPNPITGESLLSSKIKSGDAAGWLIDCLGGHEGETAVLKHTLRAMQQSRRGDLAQRNTFADLIMSKFASNSASKLVFTTVVSKFPQYSMNVTHRLLNWILPASSIYYVATDWFAKNTQIGKDLNIDEAQFHKNLAQAIRVDMLHMGASMVAIILCSILGAIQPPDDDKDLCNLDEWLFFGHRVREMWWIRDILGMALPIAAWSQSCMMGKPQFSLITDGISEACYSNPFLRASDAFDMFINPEGNIFAQYKTAQEDYKDAPGGGPDNILEFMIDNAQSQVVRTLGQFVTPAFVKQLAQMGDYEHSYKKVYSTNIYGGERDENHVERVSYSEAMLRKYLRGNPWLATIADVIFRPSTGYREDEMPYTTYYDEYQLESARENAEKDPMAILITLQKYYGHMDELQATGFYLDRETKAAVSQEIWDLYYSAKTKWNEFAANEGSDFYALGDGSYALGKQRYYEYKEACQQEQNYWRQFYYDVIKNSYLSDPMQTYYRYKTNYESDVTGDIRATGYHLNGILPFPVETAPGTVSDPEGTAGYENRFNTISAVTGMPLSERALVPVNSEAEEWPEFEAWSEDQSGNSYSSRYMSDIERNTTGTYNSSDSANPSSSSGKSYYSRKSSGGGGGGGRRSGGSGGGGYSTPPRINVGTYTPSPVSPSRIMNSDRIERANDTAYLRPDFETKGSRDAYRRSDI